MKNRTLTLLSLLFAMATMVLTIGNGCATAGSYQLKQTRNDVDWAMTRYHNRLAFGFLTPQERESVSDAYKAYQTAFTAAVKQANGNYNTPTPANVKQLADQLFTILDSIP